MADPLTLAAVLALAVAPQCTDGEPLDPYLIAGIAKHESAFHPEVTHRNSNGTTDFGLMQINSMNFRLLGLTPETWMEPCHSIMAATRLLKMVSRYNTGSPTRGLAPCGPGAPPGCEYTTSTLQAVWKVKGQDTELPAQSTNSGAGSQPAKPACAAPSWDVWGQADCRDHPPVLRAEPVVPEIREEVADATIN